MAQARELATSLTDNSTGITDCYIDDIPPICVEEGLNTERCTATVSLAIDSFSTPISQGGPIARGTILSLTKLLGEGTMQDAKVILGWKMDSHLLSISLSDDKYACWTKDTEAMITKQGCSFALFETTVGRLEHVGHIMPALRNL
jgi:hypothetical protein